MDTRVLYLYGVVAGDQRLPCSELARLEPVASSGLTAIVEQVAKRDFSAEVLEHRLQDLGWVAPLARKHQHVLEDVMACGAVIPAPLCTLFSSSDAVRDSLAANEERFAALLASLAGRREWGVKIYCDHRALPGALGPADPALQAIDRALAAASPGQAYVLRKRRDRRVDDLAAQHIDHVIDDVLQAIDSLAVDARLRSLPPQPGLDAGETVILNAAFLVDVAAAEELHAISARLASRLDPEGFALELSGPWPPYSFCDEEAQWS